MSKRQIRQGRNAPHRTKLDLSIKRIPADFGWKFLNRLLDCFRPFLAGSFVCELESVIRSRDLVAYHGLSKKWSAQWAADLLYSGPPYKAAMSYQLGKLLTKTIGMDAVPRQERRAACLEEVFNLDQSLDSPILLEPDDPVFRATQRWVQRFMGEAPDEDEVCRSVRHGPGSTATTLYKDRHAFYKYACWPYAVTHNCWDRFKQMIQTDERWLGSLEQDYRRRLDIDPWLILEWDQFWDTVLVVQEANVVTSVPKNGMRDRPIAKEPLGNVYLQCGYGSILKERLRSSSGVDLYDQSRNRQLAQLASTWNSPLSPCTLDLSSASDTIAEPLVQALCSPGWFRCLHSVRSEYGEVPNKFCWQYRKWSSMGNATTFELESIVFLGLLYAVIEVHGDRSDIAYTSVFGDDLVFPRYLAPIVKTYLSRFGFKVNHEKSFVEGMFFESCGSDWLNGYNIRPFFLRRIPEQLADLITCHNQLYCWFVRNVGSEPPRSLTDWLRSYAPQGARGLVGRPCELIIDKWFFQNGRPPERSLQESVQDRLKGDFWFRKLQHNLLSCESDGGSRFDIPHGSRVKLSHQAPAVEHYGVFDSVGCLQDQAWPEYESTFATSP